MLVRSLSLYSLALLTLLLAGRPVLAQDKDEEEELPPLRIEGVRVGYSSYNPGDGVGRFKVGMWTPVYVRLAAGKKGFPERGDVVPKIQIETNDSEDVGTIYTIDTRPLKPKESETFIGYVRTGNVNGEIRVKVMLDGRVYKEENATRSSPQLGSLLVLTLGASVDGMQEAMDALNAPREGGFRDFQLSKYAAYESSVRQLPDLGMGYEAADLIILCTSNKKFLKELATDPKRIEALSYYVRNGGRMAISVTWENQDLLDDVLRSEAWKLPLPITPPRDAGPAKGRTYPRLVEVESWGQAERNAFPPAAGPAIFANLDPGNVPPGQWDVLAKATDGKPVIAKMRYGLGQITYLGFPLEEPPFRNWMGRTDFLKSMVPKLTPREALVAADRDRGLGGRSSNDVAGDLQRQLDVFDVQVVPFGLVALFIIVYILIVGPLDYFVLKYIFKRLEWTWFTFPAVVLVVTIAAYYTAYALKGNDQKINQVDLIDFDLRTNLDDKLQTKKTYVTGQSFLTVLSPRIQAYTIGMKPNPVFLGFEENKDLGAAQPVSWLGRPDPEAFGMGRRGSQGLYRKPYRYAPDAAGLEKVPVAVWTTKSFQARWDTILDTPPFEANLFHHKELVGGRNVTISGTFTNNLPCDLMDVWFIYNERCYQIKNPIPGHGKEKVKIQLEADSTDVNTWSGTPDSAGIGAIPPEGVNIRPAPTITMKTILFHERTRFGSIHNHLLRGLDQSSRLETKRVFGADPSVREVIVYARLKQKHGKSAELGQSTDQPLPTQLWLGELPDGSSPRPDVLGSMTHDTYIRIYLPLYPADAK